MTFGRKVACAASMATVAYGGWVRPRLWRWGATDEEVNSQYPGGDLVPGGERGATMAVTIEAPPEQVWPWLVQMGGDRGGWYSWDRLDNGGRPSAQQVHPEWQALALGDHVKYWTRNGPVDAWEVAALEQNRFLGLRGLYDLRGRSRDPKRVRPSAYVEGLWGFLLTELPGGSTRLVIGGYQAIRPRWLGRFVFYWFYVPVTWIMQARMLAVLKRNIERAASWEHPRSLLPDEGSARIMATEMARPGRAWQRRRAGRPGLQPPAAVAGLSGDPEPRVGPLKVTSTTLEAAIPRGRSPFLG